MSAPRAPQIVLLEFRGVEPRNSLTVLAERLPQRLVQVWDVLTEEVLRADSLPTFARSLISDHSLAASPVTIVGSCFGAQLVDACLAQWPARLAAPVVTVAIDPVIVGEEVLQAQAASLAARLGANVPLRSTATSGWLDDVLAELHAGAVRQSIAEGDDPADAADVAELLTRHYRLWLRYLWLCRQDRASAHVARAVFSTTGRAPAPAAGEVIPIGPFPDTSDVLASEALAAWILEASATKEGGG